MLEKRLYNIILWCALTLSILSIITNTIGNFPWTVNIKWVILSLVTIICFIHKKSSRNIEKTKLGFFLFIIIVFAPISFFDSGGSVNNALGYSYIVLMCVIYLFDGKKRNILVVIHILMVTLIHIVEHMYPHLVKVYADESNYIEKLTQIPIIMIAIYLITSQFANAYLAQKKKQEMDNERLEILANYDSITNLYNRRAFNQVLNSSHIALPEPNSVYVIIIDLDYFKHINDQLGHLTGDYVLKEFARKLKMLVSNPNVVCRWGGDEFAILFHGEKESLETLLKKTQEGYSEITSGLDINTSISIGVALWDASVSVKGIMKKADMKLYEVKSKGGGQYAFGDI